MLADNSGQKCMAEVKKVTHDKVAWPRLHVGLAYKKTCNEFTSRTCDVFTLRHNIAVMPARLPGVVTDRWPPGLQQVISDQCWTQMHIYRL